jgi:tRNA modification GTPase
MSAASPQGRASLLTPAGRGAVAVIAAEGAAALAAVDAHFRAANRLRLSAQPLNRIVFGHWLEQHAAEASLTTSSPARAASREEVVVCRTDADCVEIHCHGGVAAAERILGALAADGCTIAPWRERLPHKAETEIAAEVETALASAGTLRSAAILLDQLHGALASEIRNIQFAIAAATDESTREARQRLAALLDRSNVGLHLAQPWRAAIAGRPNVGKSSLLNMLAGYQRAIVFDQPGTTRDVLAVETAIDGWPVQLGDAAGLRCPADELEEAGVALAKEGIVRADLVVWVLDAAALSPADLSDPRAAAERQIAAELSKAPASWLAVVNKRDLAVGPIASGAVATCALTGDGLDDLLVAVANWLVPKPPEHGAAVPFTMRQVDLLQTAARQVIEHDLAGAHATLVSLT